MLIKLHMGGHLVSEYCNGTLSASSALGCSLTDEYWICTSRMAPMEVLTVARHLAVLINLLPILWFAWPPDLSSVLQWDATQAVSRREGLGMRVTLCCCLKWQHVTQIVELHTHYFCSFCWLLLPHSLPFFSGLTCSKCSMLQPHLYHKFRGIPLSPHLQTWTLNTTGDEQICF